MFCHPSRMLSFWELRVQCYWANIACLPCQSTVAAYRMSRRSDKCNRLNRASAAVPAVL